MALVSQLTVEFPDVSFRYDDYRSSDEAAQGESVIVVWLGAAKGSNGIAFDQLPVLPRLDASFVNCDRVEFVRDVLRAALAR
jgi:hypothetical protein